MHIPAWRRDAVLPAVSEIFDSSGLKGGKVEWKQKTGGN
jgi:hypothetical protein